MAVRRGEGDERQDLSGTERKGTSGSGMREASLRLGRVSVTSGALLALCLVLCFGEERELWLLSYLAGLLHELGHAGIAWLLGLEIAALRLSFSGAELVIPGRGGLPPLREAALLLAGPAVNLVLAALALRRGEALFGELNLLLAGFNLLPVRPLDGGELLCLGIAGGFPGADGERIVRRVGQAVTLLLLAAGAGLAWGGNPALLVLGLWLWLSNW